jgi:hypothetical protein
MGGLAQHPNMDPMLRDTSDVPWKYVDTSTTECANEVLAMFNMTDPAVIPRSFVLVLALETDEYFPDSMHDRLLSTLRGTEKISVLNAERAGDAVDFLSRPGLMGVLVTDAGISRRQHNMVLSTLVEYARSGGTVVIGASFTSNISYPAMDAFLGKSWNLPWRMGEYHRTTFALNPSHDIVASRNVSLPASYSMKAVHLKNVASEDALYTPTENSHLESRVFPSVAITNLEEVPVAFKRVGSGFFGYVGDVNTDPGSTQVILGMLGLL